LHKRGTKDASHELESVQKDKKRKLTEKKKNARSATLASTENYI